MKKRIEINTNEFYDVDRLINHTEVRNTIIRAFWEGLTYSNQSYNQRINTTKTFFNVSKATIEKCLYNR